MPSACNARCRPSRSSRPDRIDVVDVAAAGRFDRRLDASGPCKQAWSSGAHGLARASVHGFEMAQLDAQDRALDAVHAVVEALQDVVVALFLAPVAQHADRSWHVLVVVGDDDAALAVGAEVLAGIEAEAAGHADAAGAAALVLGAVRLAGVLDDGNAVAVGDRA